MYLLVCLIVVNTIAAFAETTIDDQVLINTRKGYWRISNSPILNTTLTN